VVDANGLTSGKVRLTVTGGLGALGSGAPHGPVTVVAVAEQQGSIPAPYAVTVPWARNEMGATAGLKTTSYAENVRALRYAHERNAGEAIFANTRGELCEGTGTNVFVVVDDKIQTPPLVSGCLAGVTRDLVLGVADVTEITMPLEVLETAQEIFLTSSTRDVQAMSRIDRRDLAAPGPITAEVAATFAALKTADLDP
jgi:branched-chain amino acid aminotransferase